MKAVQILSDMPGKVAFANSLSKPVPSGKEILIRVRAAGVTADEVNWPEVYRTASRIPGHDISGIIAELGPDYDGPLKVGDAVFAMLDVIRGQGQAEYAKATPDDVALKPKTLSHAQAAALPIPILTAWEALHRHASVQSGAKILVTGASGAVGLLVVQLAKLLFDANTVALASSEKHEYLRELGAAEVNDYRTQGWEERIQDVDVVIDTVGSSVLSKSWQTLKKGAGTIVTVADPPPTWAFSDVVPPELAFHPRAKYIYFVLSTDPKVLRKVANMLDEGTIKTLPVVEFPYSRALEAWDFATKRQRKGKVVITFHDEAN